MTFPVQPMDGSELVAMIGTPDAARKAETLRQLAVFQMSHGAFQLAERMACVAMWLEPGNGRNWQTRAYCLARMNKPKDAMRLLNEARSKGVAKIGLRDLAVIGFAFARSGQLREARQFLLPSKTKAISAA